ncbi:MAG: OmpW/AlkL family protein [Alphaproteobacteria bacterium]
MKQFLRTSALVVAAFSINSAVALAHDTAFDVVTKARLFGTFPDQTQKFNTAPLNASTSASKDKVFDRGFGGEFSGTYFYNANVASEIGVGIYGQKFKSFKGVSDLYSSTPAPSTKSKRSFFVPVTATLQFHVDPVKEFSPYFGAGYHYTFSTHSSKVAKVSNQHGAVVQVGADIFSKDNYGFNLDVKKYWSKGHIKYKAPVTSMPVKAKYKADPTVVGFGITWRM